MQPEMQTKEKNRTVTVKATVEGRCRKFAASAEPALRDHMLRCLDACAGLSTEYLDMVDVGVRLRMARLQWQRNTVASALRDALDLIGDPDSTVLDVQHVRRVGDQALATITGD